MARRLLAALALLPVLAAASPAAAADELLWARRSAFGGMTTIVRGDDGGLACTGCKSDDYGRLPIVADRGIDRDTIESLQPWMSTLWVVLFRLDTGNACATGEWYALSLLRRHLRRIDTARLDCADVTISMAETTGTGARVTLDAGRGNRLTTEIP